MSHAARGGWLLATIFPRRLTTEEGRSSSVSVCGCSGESGTGHRGHGSSREPGLGSGLAR